MIFRSLTWGFILALFFLLGCSKNNQDEFLFSRWNDRADVHFMNSISENDSLNAFKFLYIYNGSGVAVADLNQDGLKDIVFGGNMVTSEIYLNKGEFQFEKLDPLSSGFLTNTWVHGVSIVDINGDGLNDIYCSVGGIGDSTRNLLFINNGDLSFTEKAKDYGLDDASLTTHTVFLDYDNDGDLDAYLINYENNPNKDPNTVRPKNLKGNSKSQDRLYRNDSGSFVDITLEAGIGYEGYGLGISVTDFNNDGWLDLYISNDFIYDDLLFINNQDGTFKESLKEYFSHTSNFGMGIDIADLNNDGFNDVVQVDMLPEDNRRQKKLLSGLNYDRYQMLIQRDYTAQYMRNSVQLNTGTGKFQEVGLLTGMSNTDWSWSPLIADFNNDGQKDIFITNGYVKDVTDVDFRDYIVNESRNTNAPFNPSVIVKALNNLKGEMVSNYAYMNMGGLEFQNMALNWGLEEPSFSTGSAYGDLDNDGDLDLIVNNLNQESFVYKNQSVERDSVSYFQLDLKVNGNVNLALGSSVQLFVEDDILSSEFGVYRGFQSTVDPVLHFGLPKGKVIDSLVVFWPDNSRQVISNPGINQRLELNKEALTVPVESNPLYSKKELFADLAEKYKLTYNHEESSFVDFKREALLPHKLSTEGPIAAVGDVNNDGLSDIYVGSAAGSVSKLFIQEHSINGASFSEVTFSDSKDYEDASALFVDIDNDGDLDLYVVSGSVESQANSETYKDRLYLNNGKGRFIFSDNRLPAGAFSGSKVVSNDFDNDGDIDLFVGGYVLPGSYPKPSKSQLLVNEEGVFTDKIDQLAPELNQYGIIKDAAWADVDQDGDKELVLAGEFMPISIFDWSNGKLIDKTNEFGLSDYSGWWNTIELVDLDQDGDLDIIGGNLGLNSRYKASKNQPLSIYANDYDANGQLDAVIAYYNNNKEYVIHDRVTLTQQISAIKKKFPLNLSFAEATISEVFDAQSLNDSYIVRATHFESSIFINNGKGGFEFVNMPIEAQFTRVNDILVFDYDEDGLLDILLAGNSDAPEVFNGKMDAQSSLLLKGTGNGMFEPVSLFGSGFVESGVVTGLERIEINGKTHILTLKNNEELGLYAVSDNVTAIQAQF